MSENPYIEGFKKLEEIRSKENNVFEQAKKLEEQATNPREILSYTPFGDPIRRSTNFNVNGTRWPATWVPQSAVDYINRNPQALSGAPEISPTPLRNPRRTQDTNAPLETRNTTDVRSVFYPNPNSTVSGPGQAARPGAINRASGDGAAMLRGQTGAMGQGTTPGSPRPIATTQTGGDAAEAERVTPITSRTSAAPLVQTSVAGMTQPTVTPTPTNVSNATDITQTTTSPTISTGTTSGRGTPSSSAGTTSAASPSRETRDTQPSPTRTNAANITPGLSMGRPEASEIRAAQEALGITADGIAGPQTRQAIMNFQRERGLQVDGIIGDQTRTALAQFQRAQASDRRNSPNMMADSFTPDELAHIEAVLSEAMPVAPTSSDSSPNPTPKNKAEGGRGRGTLTDEMDPVGKEDEDIDNDGDSDESDEYLRRRRKAISSAMKEE